jgi:outer membrane immunogenic protein
MRMHNRLQGLALAAMGAAVTLCGGGVARADGLPPGPPPYGPPPMSYERPYGYGCCTWAGFYGGVNVGYGWSPNSDQLALSFDSPTGLSPEGGFGGGQIGYNWQVGNLVFGAEADLQGADISDRVQDFVFGDTFHSSLNWFGTVRGRLGYGFDRALVYATAGFAYGGVRNSVDLVGFAPYRFDGTATGYVLGVGVEYKFGPAWSIKGEYQYINLGTNDPTNPAGAPYSAAAGLGVGVPTVRDDEYHTFRMGLNYRFGGGY